MAGWETPMDELTRWVIDMLRAQEDEERRKRREWRTLDRFLSEALDTPFTSYSANRAAMGLLIADMADQGWKWNGIALDDQPMGPIAFVDGKGNGGAAQGDTVAHATAEAAAKALGID